MRRRQQGGEVDEVTRRRGLDTMKDIGRHFGEDAVASSKRRASEISEAVKRKRGGGLPPQFKKKKAPPFESKVEGGNARRRADRRAMFKRGGKVETLADAEPVSNTQVKVPAGGAVKQKFQAGGEAGGKKRSYDTLREAGGYQFGGRVAEHSVRSQYHGGPQRTRTTTVSSRFRDPHPVTGLKKGGVEKRQEGGPARGKRTLNEEMAQGASRNEPERRELTEKRFLEGKNYQAGGGISSRRAVPGGPRPSDEELVRGPREGLKSGGHITTAQRKALPSSEFALPGKGTGAGGKGPGSYPIDTENRARNALARGAQHASPGQLATIKRKVKAKYPGIDVGGE